MRIFNIFNENKDHVHINQTFYATNEGSIGTILGMSKEIFDYFCILEKGLLNNMKQNRFNYEMWRSVKVIRIIFYAFIYDNYPIIHIY